ncbi:MAG TPA: DNA repair exonuclease [Ornithinimicrobium sp.]|uniref:metallophosphoesterase family protein n=1 Tax=Ornithinimicrobium sp. TaxID=1977084 RepID=UPI002B467E80|nr:DNA repair exonuclease [Ornithinimicrobium sp.]HKJ10781.1 DNA repair exonuclease [Ornithinimicrobium sp.]
MVTFLHTADWQLGMTRRWLEPEAQARFDDDRVRAIRRAGRLAREQGCEFVVVAGDVFEHSQLREATVRRALEAMAEVELPVYLLPGNHDPLDVVSLYRQERFRRHCPANVTVLEEVGPHRVADAVEIVAAPWRGKHPEEDLVAAALAAVPPPASGTVRLVVGHGGADLLDPQGSRRATVGIDGLRAAADRGEVHYVALGDRHSRTDVGGYGFVWYSGAIEVTDSREQAPGDVLVVQVSAGQAPVVQPHHVGSWSFEEMERDLVSAQDVDDLVDELAARTGKERVVLTMRLRGALALADYTRLHEALEGYSTVFGGLRDWDRHEELVVLPRDAEWDGLGLSGFVAEAMSEIRDLSTSASTEPVITASSSPSEHDRDDDAQSAQDALTLLYRLSGAGRR